MKARSAAWIAVGAIASLAVAAAAVVYASLAPPEVLAYAHTDRHGSVVAAIARSRARFWGSCPHGSFLPTTPIGAVVAAMDRDLPERERSLLALARTMIGKGCDVNEYGQSGTTPLMDAVLYGDPRAVELLIGLGADRARRKQPAAGRASPVDGMTPAEMAAYLLERPAGPRGDRQSVLALLKRP